MGICGQAQQFCDYDPSNAAVPTILRLLAALKAGNLSDEDQDAGARTIADDPASSGSLIIYRLLNGIDEPVDGRGMERWMAADQSERGPKGKR